MSNQPKFSASEKLTNKSSDILTANDKVPLRDLTPVPLATDVVGSSGEFSGDVKVAGNLSIHGKVGVGLTGPPAFTLDVGDRMRVREGANSAGIWFHQKAPNADQAFVGMSDDNSVGFWGNTGAYWGLKMDTSTGNIGIGVNPGDAKLTVTGWTGTAVLGQSAQGHGVAGTSNDANHAGVYGHNTTVDGVAGHFAGRVRVEQVSQNDYSAGIWFRQNGADQAFVGMADNNSVGLWGNTGANWGLKMHATTGDVSVEKGNVHVSQGDINLAVGSITLAQGDILLNGADCAEQFDTATGQALEPGTVVVLDETGALQESQKSYDTKVAGVVSGAGCYRPGIILDRRTSEQGCAPVALVGKVYCKVNTEAGPVEVGDLLTTSSTHGHAMKAVDPQKSFGAVVGKALRSLREGQALIPILIALQ